MPNISDIAKFKSDLLKIKEDIHPQSRKILQNVSVVGGTNLTPNNKKSVIFHFFAELYLCSF